MRHSEIMDIAKHICFPAWNSGTKTVHDDPWLDDLLSVRHPGSVMHHLYSGGETYIGMPVNEHHYTTGYHYKYVVPVVLDLFNIKFDINDYELVPYFLRYPQSSCPDKYHDMSYLKPKSKQSLHLYDYMCKKGKDMDTLFREWDDFDCVYDKDFGYTEYHLFLYCAHSVAKITNKNMPNGKSLLISCDSQMIPSIPILINYFGSITMLDHRYSVDSRESWMNENFDYALIAHWTENGYPEPRFDQKMFGNFGIEKYF